MELKAGLSSPSTFQEGSVDSVGRDGTTFLIQASEEESGPKKKTCSSFRKRSN